MKEPFDDKFFEALGKRLKELREEGGFSNYEHFAYEAKMSRTQIGKYENGESDLLIGSLRKFGKALDLNWDQLLEKLKGIEPVE